MSASSLRLLTVELSGRYNTQLLYGCSNPKCKTKTCFTYRRQTSTAPFRPYTVLSARALATFLASQDHPEKGLCPFVRDESCSTPRSSHTTTEDLQQVKEQSDGDLAQQNEGFSVESTEQDTKIDLPMRRLGRWPSLQRLHESIWPRPQETPDVERSESIAEPPSSKTKDPKSFAQNVFDTFAMRLLHAVPKPPIRTLTPTDSMSHESRTHFEDKNTRADESGGLRGVSTPEGSTPSVDEKGVVSIAGLHEQPETKPRIPTCSSSEENIAQLNMTMAKTNAKRDDLGADFECSKLATGLANGNPTSLDSASGPSQLRLRDTCARQHRKASSSLQTCAAEQSAVSTLGKANINPKSAQGSPSYTSTNCQLPTGPVKCFTKLSEGLISKFIASQVSEEDIDRRQRNLLRALGRTSYVTQTSSRSHIKLRADHHDCLTQTVVYVCGDANALAKSFTLSQSEEGIESTKSSSDLSSITSAFGKLYSCGIEPTLVFSNLWTGLKAVYANASDVTSEPTPRYTSIKSRVARDKNFINLEAAHVTKISLAALIATLPSLSQVHQEAVQRSRANGMTTLHSTVDFLEQSSASFSLVQETLDGLEDDLAVSLMTRLCRAVSSRDHASTATTRKQPTLATPEQLRERSGCDDSDFLQTLVRSLLDDTTSPFSATKSGDHLRSSTLHTTPIYSIQDSEGLAREARPDIRLLIEWLRTILIREWNSKLPNSAYGAADGAVRLLKGLCEHTCH